ncbi:MAG: hypothetical protein GEV07_14950 [Streptosporangiales bacterium]|nr:hypothetical protein [Streptosporangiales bacterium]
MSATGYLTRAVAAVALAATAVAPGLVTDQQAAAAPKKDVAFRFTDTRIDASSGLAVSPKEPEYVFTVNDHAPTRVFGINPETGRSDATMRLEGAQNVNWEALAAGRGRNLWVGDIGDNESVRDSLMLYRYKLPQPVQTGYFPVSAAYEVTYPDGAHDAEALLVNPKTNIPYVVTKGPNGRLYRADDLVPGANELTKLDGKLPPMITDGAFRPDGKQFVLRSYDTGYVYSTTGKQLGSFPLPKQQQGEGITYTADGNDLLLSSEGKRSEVLSLNVDEALAAGKKPKAKQSSKPEASEDDESGIALSDVLFIATPIVIALLAAAAAFFLRRRQRPAGGEPGGRRERKYERDEPYPAPDYGTTAEPVDADGWPVPGRRGRDAAVPVGPGAPPTIPPLSQQAPPPGAGQVPPPPPGARHANGPGMPEAPDDRPGARHSIPRHADGAPLPPPPGAAFGNGAPSPPGDRYGNGLSESRTPSGPRHAPGHGPPGETAPPSGPGANGAPPPPPGGAFDNGAPPPPPGGGFGNGAPPPLGGPGANGPPPPGGGFGNDAPPPDGAPPAAPGQGNGGSALPPPPGTRRAAEGGGRRAAKPPGGRRRRKSGGGEPFWLQE